MALYFSEGFDNFGAAADFVKGGWTKINDGSDLYLTVDATGSRWGGPCVKMESRTTQASMWKNIPVAMSGTTLRVAFWFKCTQNMQAGIALGASIPFLTIEDATPGNWVDFRLSSNSSNSTNFVAQGGLLVTRTETARSGLTNYINGELQSIKRLNDGLWHHVELEMVINNSTGSAKLWIDGELQYNLSSIDTSDGATNISTFTRVRISSGYDANASQFVWLDDIIVWDDSGTEFTGALPNKIHRINTLRPSGAGASAAFTPSAGSNFQNVDEQVANEDTDYNEQATTSSIDSFAFDDMSWTVDEIFGINIKSRAKFDTTGANFRNKMRISGTYYNGATVALTAAYAMYETIFNNDPSNTANNLTKAVIDAAEFGYERTV